MSKIRQEKDKIADLIISDPEHRSPSLRKCTKSLFGPPDSEISEETILGILEYFLGKILSPFLSTFSPICIQKPLILLFSQQPRGSGLALFFLSLVLGPQIWGFKGVDIAF